MTTIPQSALRRIFAGGSPKDFRRSPEHYFYSPRTKVPALRTLPKLRTYVGKVAKTDFPRTCVVQVVYSEMNPEVNKVYQHSHNVYVHDPDQTCYVGDEVLIGPRETPNGVAYHGKPYQVLKTLKMSEGYTDHYEGKVWLRSERDNSYTNNTTRILPRYMEELLPEENLKFVKGTREALSEIAKGQYQ